MPEQKNEPSLPKGKAKESSPKRVEKYWKVRFHERSDDTDLEYHYLNVNGEALQVKKGSEVVVPERFLEVADNAKIKKYKRGRPVGEVSRVPYTRLEESSEAEYLKMKREGTNKHRAELEQRNRAAEKDIEG